MSRHGMSGCRALSSSDSRRDASEMISRLRMTAAQHVAERATLLSEGIDGVARRRRAQVRLQRVAVDHVHRAIEQVGNVLLEVHILVDRAFGARLELHQDVYVAARPVVAARHRSEHGRTADAGARSAGSAAFSLAMMSSRRMVIIYSKRTVFSASQCSRVG